jgi:N4-gp56 family major capsid protein
MNTYGDISPRTAAYVSSDLLERAKPFMVLSLFGQQKPIPKNKTQAVKFRRYNALKPSLTPLTEGVTPAPDAISVTDVQATLQQFGRHMPITDVILDTHEDPVLTEMTAVMAELAAQTNELIIYNALRAGLNVIFCGGTSRATVSSGITTVFLDRAIRQLKRQNAKKITKRLEATDKVGTAPIRGGYIGFCHVDVQTDLEKQPGWKDITEYGTTSVISEAEIGAYKETRWLTSTLFEPWLAAGASGSTLLTNGGTGTGNCDVYPLLICADNAYATVSLGGSTAVQPIVVNPKPSDSDPLAQRGHVGFKMWATALILNDAWFVRLECGVAQ